MSQYYFTVASLPMLDFEGDPPVTYDSFIETCSQTLTPEDLLVVKSARIDDFESGGGTGIFLEKWNKFEQSLRNELVKLRSVELGIDGNKYIRDFIDETSTPVIARNAFKMDDPSKAEEYLDKTRWSFLDDMEAGHFFDLEKLIVFSLKLQLLERRAKLTSENGAEVFRTIYEKIKTEIKNA